MVVESQSRRSQFIPIILFVCLTFLDWYYLLLAQQEPDIHLNAWFVLFPTLSFFYFVFAFVATVGLILNTIWGYAFAYCSILFGAVSVAVSYNIIYKTNSSLTHFFGVLVVINVLVIGYLVLCAGRSPKRI